MTVAEAAAVNRIRASGPILIIAVLFVVGSFLAWYFTWFGRGLSDADISKYLADYQHPRHVQHALLQIQERLERKDPSAKRWYPQILELVENPEPEFRLTVAWVMGSDSSSPEFHNALKQLVTDPEPIVRRNAALALVRFNDSSGLPELRLMLGTFTVNSPSSGLLVSSLSNGAPISRGTLLARIQGPSKELVELRSPLIGNIESLIAQNGSNVSTGSPVLTIKPDDESVWEALRALAVVGTAEDLPVIERYAAGERASDRIKQQAGLTANAIRNRPSKKAEF